MRCYRCFFLPYCQQQWQRNENEDGNDVSNFFDSTFPFADRKKERKNERKKRERERENGQSTEPVVRREKSRRHKINDDVS